MGSVTTVDEYLATLSPEYAEALQKLREIILAITPEAEEAISYQIPSYKLHGPLVSFGAAKKHLALYGMNANLSARFADELKGYDASGSTVRFTPENPLPESLVRKLIIARLEENLARLAARDEAAGERKRARHGSNRR